MIKNKLYQSIIKDPHVKSFWGQEFLRDVLIPHLLGDNTHSILYWAGKRTAQKYFYSERFDLIKFFEQTGFGKLRFLKQVSYLREWQLTGPLVQKRLQSNSKCDFMLEAGFLAGFTERQLNMLAEATINQHSNQSGIIINVRIDPHHKISPAAPHRNLTIIK